MIKVTAMRNASRETNPVVNGEKTLILTTEVVCRYKVPDSKEKQQMASFTDK